MRRCLLSLTLAASLVACSGGERPGAAAGLAAIRDSAGVALVEYPGDAWAKAPAWSLSAQPLATIGGDPADTTIDLTNSQLAALLDDGRVVAASSEPAQIHVFRPDGSHQGLLGRGGEGPGEYRLISVLLQLGGDSVMAYDFVTRHGLLFDADGESLGDLQFPVGGTQIPPLLVSRLAGNTWLFYVVNPLAQPPEGSEGIYRINEPVLTWRPGATIYDTVVMLPGASMVRGTYDIAGQSIPAGKVVGYGANTFVGGHGDLIWTTTGEAFTFTARDTAGTVRREVRFAMEPRPISESDREAFKATMRTQWELARSMGAPPQLVDSELQKIDQTTFADHRPAIGQLVVDHLGRVWITPDLPAVDSTLTWGIFDAEGSLLGTLRLPKGNLLAASEDRVVLRVEDDASSLVRFEVWGLNRP